MEMRKVWTVGGLFALPAQIVLMAFRTRARKEWTVAGRVTGVQAAVTGSGMGMRKVWTAEEDALHAPPVMMKSRTSMKQGLIAAANALYAQIAGTVPETEEGRV